jgi:lysophospholipase L1-like esterase
MRPRFHLFCTAIVLIHAWGSSLSAQDESARWESEILKLEALDSQQLDPEDAVLFVGSSSIRLWDTIAEDMAPYPTIGRGYGGAKFSDLQTYIHRLVVSHDCRAVVIFVANDITGGPSDQSIPEIIEMVSSVTSQIREVHPQTPIFFIEVTPTRSRWKVWRKIREFNGCLAEFCSDHENVHFISTASHYLDAETHEPIEDYFRGDRLHLSTKGYEVWAAIIKSRLDQVLKPESSGELLEASPALIP